MLELSDRPWCGAGTSPKATPDVNPTFPGSVTSARGPGVAGFQFWGGGIEGSSRANMKKHLKATFHLEKVREMKRSTPRESEKTAFPLGGPQVVSRRSLGGPQVVPRRSLESLEKVRRN